MITIQELLHRIRWDEKFGKGDFRIGYYDRLEGRIVRVPLAQITFEQGNHYSFQLIDEDAAIHNIPLHRVKEVYRDGKLIWHRQH